MAAEVLLPHSVVARASRRTLGQRLLTAAVLGWFALMILVPAVMTLLGRHAWWMPRWLEPVLPNLRLEGSKA